MAFRICVLMAFRGCVGGNSDVYWWHLGFTCWWQFGCLLVAFRVCVLAAFRVHVLVAFRVRALMIIGVFVGGV